MLIQIPGEPVVDIRWLALVIQHRQPVPSPYMTANRLVCVHVSSPQKFRRVIGVVLSDLCPRVVLLKEIVKVCAFMQVES